MANGPGIELINELTYKAQIKSMPDRALQEFTAEKIFELVDRSDDLDKRVKALENRDSRAFGLTGGIGAAIGAAIAVVIDWLLRR